MILFAVIGLNSEEFTTGKASSSKYGNVISRSRRKSVGRNGYDSFHGLFMKLFIPGLSARAKSATQCENIQISNSGVVADTQVFSALGKERYRSPRRAMRISRTGFRNFQPPSLHCGGVASEARIVEIRYEFQLFIYARPER